MTNEAVILCNVIIHTASAAAAAVGAGLAQVPCSDKVIITPIQLSMSVSLGKVFGLDLDQSAASAEVSSAVATRVGCAATQVLAGRIPVAGNIINAVTAASLTETMGWSMAKKFEKQSQYV